MRKKEYNIRDKLLMNKMQRLAEQRKLQEEGKVHHKSSTLRHMVPSHSKDKGNILR